MSTSLSVEKALQGRHILFTGASGFLGKVWLSMMLDKVPQVGRIYVLLRGKGKQGARERFERMINDSYAFKVLHDRHGEDLARFIAERVEVVSGDVSQPGLGIDAKVAARIQRELDLVVHCAGQVDFNPELTEALETNVEGTLHAAEFAAGAKNAKFVQVSTCFVAGNRDGRITEQAIPNYAPLREGFDVEAEYTYLKQLAKDIYADATSPEAIAKLRADVVRDVVAKGHDANNVNLIDRIMKREEKALISDQLVQRGKDRARHWGWPNVYTFTKSMGESLLLSRFPQMQKTFFRPAIIESAEVFPLPGWNEGLNTSAPLVYFMGTWFRHMSANKDKPLDVVPVDYCCAALITASAALLEGTAKPVCQCATSDRHPLTVGRGLELTALAHRKYYRAHGEDAVERVILSRWDAKVVGDDHFMKPENLRKAVKLVGDFAKDAPDSWPEFLRKEMKKLRTKTDRVERRLKLAEKVFDTYKPFVSDNRQTFACDELVQLDPKEAFFRYEPRRLDWRKYWINQHVPGLRRWSFPIIEQEKVESYSPKYPVRLPEHQAEAAAPKAETTRRQTKAAEVTEVAE